MLITTNPRGFTGDCKMGIAQEILTGSRNIDQMRKDIVDLTSILRSHLNDLITDGREVIAIGGWDVAPCKHSDAVRFFFYENDVDSEIFDSRKKSIKSVHVKKVHSALDELVEGLIERFPELQQGLHFMRDAAQA